MDGIFKSFHFSIETTYSILIVKLCGYVIK